jgi:dCMP deaminase
MPHCDDAGHLLRDGHCIRTVHAEQNAVAQAAQHGARTAGATAYITHAPCHSCAKLLAAAGVVEVVIGAPYGGNGGIELLQAAAVLVRAAEMGETNDIL